MNKEKPGFIARAVGKLSRRKVPKEQEPLSQPAQNFQPNIEQVIFDQQKTRREEQVEGQLQEAIDKERKIVATGMYEPFLVNTGKELFQAYLASPLLVQNYQKARREAARIDDEKEYRNTVAGEMFADIAFSYLSAHLNEGNNIVIHEDRLGDFFAYRNPWAKKVKNHYDKKHLMHVYMPDGLVINEEGKIKGVVEQTLSYDPDKFKRQYEYIQNFFEKGGEFLADNPVVIFATPTFSEEKEEKLKEFFGTLPEDVQHVPLPFTHSEFRSFFGRAYAHPLENRQPLGDARKLEKLKKIEENKSIKSDLA